MRLRICFLLTAAIACGCAAPAEISAETYVVQPDDTLYGIAWRHDIDFKELADWNNLGPSMRLTPGQILTLSPTRVLSPSPQAGGPAAASSAPRAVPGPSRVPELPAGFWVWPTRAFGTPTSVSGGGVLILGALSQDVMAAASGKVVYVGSGLRGYGNLVIIKHSDSLLSAYAHNQQLSVREGQWVKAGERIGAMGLGPRQTPALYFEIRLNGKPVNVAPYLSAK